MLRTVTSNVNDTGVAEMRENREVSQRAGEGRVQPTIDVAVRPPGSRRPPGRRDELLAAALEVIRAEGPAASMDDMAARAGITKPVLYRYFGDRDGLIAALGERFSTVLAGRLGTALESRRTQSPESRIRGAIDAYVRFIEEDPALYGFLTQHAAADSAALVAVVERVAGLVEQAIKEAFLAAGLDVRPAATWAHGIVGMVHLAGARWARRPDVPRSRLVGDLTALVARGLLGAASPVQPSP